MDSRVKIKELKGLVREFYLERRWENIYTAKELAAALSTETGELLNLFLWKDDLQVEKFLKSAKGRRWVGSELADIFFFMLVFSDKYGFDLTRELKAKIERNKKRYPIRISGSKEKA
jgi:MazG nucleotide pyrophosphohydrolase domain.